MFFDFFLAIFMFFETRCQDDDEDVSSFGDRRSKIGRLRFFGILLLLLHKTWDGTKKDEIGFQKRPKHDPMPGFS